jgi:hypothetical protein
MTATRQYHQTGSRLAYKDDQDRETLRPRPNDGTKSGSDSDVADTGAAYDPKTTDPVEAGKSVDRESGGNPLEASGANQEFSQPHNPEEATERRNKTTHSAGGKQKKHGKTTTEGA